MGGSFYSCVVCDDCICEDHLIYCEDCNKYICVWCLEDNEMEYIDNKIINCSSCEYQKEKENERLEFCKKYNIPIEELRKIL
jgi:hypothetical protein